MSSNEHQEWYQQLLATDCPSGHLGPAGIDGYLFAVQTQPEPPGISIWLDGIFHYQPPPQITHSISAGLWQRGVDIAEAVRQECYQLPAACLQCVSSLREWQSGFVQGLALGPEDWEQQLAGIPYLDVTVESATRLYCRLLGGQASQLDASALQQLVSEYQQLTNSLRALSADS